MHRTEAGERKKALRRNAKQILKKANKAREAGISLGLPEAHEEAYRLEGDAAQTLADAHVLKPLIRLEDLHIWQMEKETTTKNGSKTYTYWMASWREGSKVRNIHLGSSRKMDAEAARQKAQKLKAKALGIA